MAQKSLQVEEIGKLLDVDSCSDDDSGDEDLYIIQNDEESTETIVSVPHCYVKG